MRVHALPSLLLFFFEGYGDHRDLHSFPTRRSSDLKLPIGPPPISPKVFNSRTEGRRALKVISVSHNLRFLNTLDLVSSLYDLLFPRYSKTNVCFGCISRTVRRREMKPPQTCSVTSL